MAHVPVVEALIAGEEGGAILREQELGQAIVFDALLADLPADQEAPNSPAPEELPLALRDVLVEDDHRFGEESGLAGLEDEIVDMIEERSGRELKRLSDRLPRDASVPLLDDRLPGHPVGDLFQDV